MSNMTDEEIVIVVQGKIDGETIQYRRNGQETFDYCIDPIWDFHNIEYRIKPKPREYYVNLNSDGCIGGTYKHLDVAKNMKSKVSFKETIKVMEVV